MGCRVKYTARAQRDLEAAFRWIAKDAPEDAIIWRAGLLKAVERLKEYPLSGVVAPESQVFKVEVRQLLHGKGHGIYKKAGDPMPVEQDLSGTCKERCVAPSQKQKYCGDSPTVEKDYFLIPGFTLWTHDNCHRLANRATR
jgi:plasmid stabilization system protein ParE